MTAERSDRDALSLGNTNDAREPHRRVIFKWINDAPHEVRIVDYHSEGATMAENEFAPVTPGEMLKKNSWLRMVCRRASSRRP